jgi:6-phosphogluconolactonase
MGDRGLSLAGAALLTVTPWVPEAGPATPAVVAVPAALTALTVYVGTYTDTTSRGIYRFALDTQTGAASEPVLAAEARNPSFLALHPSGRFLYAVSETWADGVKTGAVSAYAIDPKTADLTLLNQQPSEGAGPTHLVVDAGGRNVLVANYGGGTVAVLPIGDDGRLARASSVQAHEGRGPSESRQDKPHAHGIYVDATGRRAFAADLGADRVFVYDFDPAKGQLRPAGAAALPPGSGPRHLAFDARGRRLYAINELSSTLTVFAFDAAAGRLTSLQSVSTLPSGFTGANTTAEVVISPDGRFLYGSNRGHDSIAVFAVDSSNGQLTPAGHVAAGGAQPRHFAIDPSGRFMLVAHQGSDSIAVFRLDPATGRSTATGKLLRVPKPVCVLPVQVAR